MNQNTTTITASIDVADGWGAREPSEDNPASRIITSYMLVDGESSGTVARTIRIEDARWSVCGTSIGECVDAWWADDDAPPNVVLVAIETLPGAGSTGRHATGHEHALLQELLDK